MNENSMDMYKELYVVKDQVTGSDGLSTDIAQPL